MTGFQDRRYASRAALLLLRIGAAALLLPALFCWLPAAPQPRPGQVRGKIPVPASDDLTEELLRGRSLVRYEMHMHGMMDPVQPYRLAEKAVIYIEPAAPPQSPSPTPARFDPPEIHPRLNQSQMLFRPLVLPVVAGTTVDFPNHDNLFHNVFSYSQPKEFDLGRYPRGQIKSVRFDTPGVVKVYCDIHSYMYATILVLDNPYFALPDEKGDYEISGVPPGRYRVSYWYGRKKAASRPVEVEEGKAAIVNFEQ